MSISSVASREVSSSVVENPASTQASLSHEGIASAVSSICSANVCSLTKAEMGTEETNWENIPDFSKISHVFHVVQEWIQSIVQAVKDFALKFFKKDHAAESKTVAVSTEIATSPLESFYKALTVLPEEVLRSSFELVLTEQDRTDLFHEVWVQAGSNPDCDPHFGELYIRNNFKGDLLVKAAAAVLAKRSSI